MKLVCLLAISCAVASAYLSHDTPLPTLFDDSDIVFSGRSMTVQATSPRRPNIGTSMPRDWVVVFSIVSQYKGHLPGPTAELLIPNVPWDMPARPGMNWLVFARNGIKTLTLVDDQAMLPFWDPPASSGKGLTGLAKIENDLLSVGIAGGPDSAAALEMLFRFPGLSKESIGILRSFEPHGWDDGDVLRFELLAHQGSPADVETLLTVAAGRDGARMPAWDRVGSIISQKTGTEHLPALQRLCDSNFASFCFDAMISIRNLADPRTIPFLIRKLRAPDKIIAYEAVMALSAITGKSELATSIDAFEKSPEQYVVGWEKWYAASGAIAK